MPSAPVGKVTTMSELNRWGLVFALLGGLVISYTDNTIVICLGGIFWAIGISLFVRESER